VWLSFFESKVYNALPQAVGSAALWGGYDDVDFILRLIRDD
jgi:hypothetical protein